MLSELPAQAIPTWTNQPPKREPAQQVENVGMQEDTSDARPEVQSHKRPSHLLLLPVPCLGASPDFPNQLLEELVKPCLVNESGEATLSVIDDSEGTSAPRQLVSHQLSYQIDGLSLLLKSAAVSRRILMSCSSLLTIFI